MTSMRERLVVNARLLAMANAPYTGFGTLSDRAVIDRCRQRLVTPSLVHTVIFTRDAGMHSCGWWKNPDYERCFHLSLSFLDRATGEVAPHDHKEARRWCELFYDPHSPALAGPLPLDEAKEEAERIWREQTGGRKEES